MKQGVKMMCWNGLGMIGWLTACGQAQGGKILIDGEVPVAVLDNGVGEGSGDLDPESTGELTAKIVNGALDRGHPSVGSLQGNTGLCTATLIGRRTVLTARHCIGSTMTFTVGGYIYPVVRAIMPSGSSLSDDFALVFLGQDAIGVTPSSLNVDPIQIGQTFTLVGYGWTGEQGFNYGTKRVGQNRISSDTNTTYSFGYQGTTVCDGDSGGPSFVISGGIERVAGVHSTKAGVCGAGGTDIRVDVFKDSIQQWAGGDVVLPGTGVAREGESCADMNCANGLACTSAFQPPAMTLVGKFCMERCVNPGGQDPICDGGEQCINSRTAGAVCFNPNNAAQGFTSR